MSSSEGEPDAGELGALRGAIDFTSKGYLWQLFLLKRALLARFPPRDALLAFVALFPDRTPETAAELPLESLERHARAHATDFTVLLESGALPLRMPRIVGEGEPALLEAPGRTLFVAALRDAVVSAGSLFIETRETALYDFQGDELEREPVEFGYDAVALDARDRKALIARFGSGQRIDEAISLVGSSSNAFGHWVSEYLLKLFLLDAAGKAARVPVLVDAVMPEQHRQALEFFTRGERPILELDPLTSIRVGKLWVGSSCVFFPPLPRPGSEVHARHHCPPVDYLARLLERVRQPDRPAEPATRLFLSRRPELRALTNLEEHEALCRKKGFRVVYPEDLRFDQQLALCRAATHVVAPAGSALILIFLYGASRAKILELHPPYLEDTPVWTSIGEARGQEIVLARGDLVREDPLFRGNVDYAIDPARTAEVLARWGI